MAYNLENYTKYQLKTPITFWRYAKREMKEMISNEESWFSEKGAIYE